MILAEWSTGATMVFLVVFYAVVFGGAFFMLAALTAVNVRGRRERARGYSTLDPYQSMEPKGYVTAREVLHTDLLWQLDPETGAVVRPPLDHQPGRDTQGSCGRA
jgi:hypothetical protein